RPVVVVQLGNNGSATKSQLDEMMRALDGAQRVLVITANAPRAWRDTINDRFGDLRDRYANVELIDWNAVVESDRSLVGHDQVHLSPAGSQRLAQMVSAAVAGS